MFGFLCKFSNNLPKKRTILATFSQKAQVCNFSQSLCYIHGGQWKSFGYVIETEAGIKSVSLQHQKRS